MKAALLVLFVLFVAFDVKAESAEATSVEPYATFALIIGVNKSVDASAATLRYADDDAARYVELFRTLGARSYVLSRLDEDTRRVHPQIAAETSLPVKAEFDKVTTAVAADIAKAHERHIKTLLYFVYAGHGNVKDGRGYIALEDARLDVSALQAEVLDKIGADQTHFIVDACYSYFLALERGPGGVRHQLHGFTQFGGLIREHSVGLLLSNSSARESHEWAGVQAGIFSHEVRSGLYGAADADGDGRVSYREIAAFVERANASISNARFRSEVYAHPPSGSDVLVDLRAKSRPRVEIPASLGSRYLLEDSRGVRVADLHNDAQQTAYLLKPVSAGRLYLRRLNDDVEFVIPGGPELISLSDLSPQEPRSRARGAANDAFESLFALPFDHQVVRTFRPHAVVSDEAEDAVDERRSSWTEYAGFGLLGLGVVATVGSSVSLASAHSLRASVAGSVTQTHVTDVNEQIRARNTFAAVGFGVAGGATLSGLLLLLWPHHEPATGLNASFDGRVLEVHSDF
ncbi:MAG TPA: caspase family protein [Polyangiaceae bacterium]|jgi:hypothetical protein|nr:caspase family protein [Polyangiaceae bacterium]